MSAYSTSRVPSKYSYTHNGELIYQRRREMGLTQEQFADLIDVDVKTVRRWEIGDVDFGKVSIRTVWHLADVLGLDFWAIASPDEGGDSPLFLLALVIDGIGLHINPFYYIIAVA